MPSAPLSSALYLSVILTYIHVYAPPPPPSPATLCLPPPPTIYDFHPCALCALYSYLRHILLSNCAFISVFYGPFPTLSTYFRLFSTPSLPFPTLPSLSFLLSSSSNDILIALLHFFYTFFGYFVAVSFVVVVCCCCCYCLIVVCRLTSRVTSLA